MCSQQSLHFITNDFALSELWFEMVLFNDDRGRKKPGDDEDENVEEEERRRRKKKQKKQTPQCSGNIKSEMHATTAERKDAAEKKSALLRHGRSENLSSSSTKQITELLLQSSGANIFNIFNLSTTTGCSRLELKIWYIHESSSFDRF